MQALSNTTDKGQIKTEIQKVWKKRKQIMFVSDGIQSVPTEKPFLPYFPFIAKFFEVF